MEDRERKHNPFYGRILQGVFNLLKVLFTSVLSFLKPIVLSGIVIGLLYILYILFLMQVTKDLKETAKRSEGISSSPCDSIRDKKGRLRDMRSREKCYRIEKAPHCKDIIEIEDRHRCFVKAGVAGCRFLMDLKEVDECRVKARKDCTKLNNKREIESCRFFNTRNGFDVYGKDVIYFSKCFSMKDISKKESCYLEREPCKKLIHWVDRARCYNTYLDKRFENSLSGGYYSKDRLQKEIKKQTPTEDEKKDCSSLARRQRTKCELKKARDEAYRKGILLRPEEVRRRRREELEKRRRGLSR